MKIFIVIPCFNEAVTIENIVQSVLSEPLTNREIIIVDDCSTDGTKEVLYKKYIILWIKSSITREIRAKELH